MIEVSGLMFFLGCVCFALVVSWSALTVLGKYDQYALSKAKADKERSDTIKSNTTASNRALSRVYDLESTVKGLEASIQECKEQNCYGERELRSIYKQLRDLRNPPLTLREESDD